jgi:hypothetical protein
MSELIQFIDKHAEGLGALIVLVMILYYFFKFLTESPFGRR